MSPAELQQFRQLNESADRLLKTTTQQLQRSAPNLLPDTKTRRIVTDLTGSDHIDTTHLAGTLQYQPPEVM